MILGSGLGAFADTLADTTAIPYADIPTMPRTGVEGHRGRLVLGRVAGVDVVAMQGRVHLYEGHPPADVVFGTRLMRWLGAERLIVTNAAGGCRSDLGPGRLLRITDHLNLTGRSPLVGPHEPALGPRFPEMNAAYDPAFGDLADRVARDEGIALATGVYAGVLGPAFETPAEIRLLRTLGADAVGMSTVLEVLAARHLGMEVLGVSVITNAAAGLAAEPPSHEEVMERAGEAAERLQRLLEGVLRALAA